MPLFFLSAHSQTIGLYPIVFISYMSAHTRFPSSEGHYKEVFKCVVMQKRPPLANHTAIMPWIGTVYTVYKQV